MLESMWAEIGDEKTWTAFVKKFAGGDSVSKPLPSPQPDCPKPETRKPKEVEPQLETV